MFERLYITYAAFYLQLLGRIILRIDYLDYMDNWKVKQNQKFFSILGVYKILVCTACSYCL